MTSKLRVGILIWDGVELLDFAGPGEVFTVAGGGEAFEVASVAATTSAVTSQGFLRIAPAYAFDDCPALDVLVVPGGNSDAAIADAALIGFIRTRAADARIVLSVCTGALLLAAAGLLDGLEVTTWHDATARLRELAPGATVHQDRRWVDAGVIVTSAGVTAGIDASLHVVARLLGEDEAQRVARYIEYTPSVMA